MTAAQLHERLLDLIFGYVPAQAIFAAAELDLADLIADGKSTLGELATATDADPEALHRLLRFLTDLGLFEKTDGRYGLTAMGRLLQNDVEGSQRANARMSGRLIPAWGEILHSLRTGETGYGKAFGRPLFQGLADNAEEAAIFDRAMTSIHGPETGAMLAAYDFSEIGCLADIGGGNASLLIEVLERYPAMHGILFDQPQVVERASAQLEHAGLAGRCRALGGDFFAELPRGGDAYLLRHIIHDWQDADAMKILSNCRQALPPDGRVLVVEVVIPEDGEPSPAYLFDLMMLVVAGGLERTEAAYRALFESADLRLTGITPTASPVSVIEARAA